MGKIAPRSRRVNAPTSVADALAAFLEKRGGKEHARLTLLWEHWGMVMGEVLAPLALPLGRKKDVLLLAAEDSMAAQDIVMQSGEVLERVNAFMDEPYFSRIQVELAGGRRDLSRARPEIRQRPSGYRVPRPEKLGSLHGAFEPASPVARCYEAYLRYFSRRQ
jgi:hypothetical protein